jgi:ribosomal protein S6--L-glutamate ligase
VKLYAIGGEVWAVRKPSPLAPNAAEPELMVVTDEARDLARRCGSLFGLELFGVDCVQSERGLSVIEVNDYPNYSCVPDAGVRIADLIEQSFEEACCAAS